MRKLTAEFIECFKRSGLNQTRFAAELGMGQSYMSMILKGERNPNRWLVEQAKGRFGNQKGETSALKRAQTWGRTDSRLEDILNSLDDLTFDELTELISTSVKELSKKKNAAKGSPENERKNNI